MSQVEEFVKIVEGVKDHDVKVVIVTGKPGSGKSKVLREAAEEKKWDYIDCRLLITEKFLEVPPGERQAKAPEMMADILEGYDSEVILLDRLQTLFVPVFHIDVDALLHKLSEKFVIVTAWRVTLKKENSVMINLMERNRSVSVRKVLRFGTLIKKRGKQ